MLLAVRLGERTLAKQHRESRDRTEAGAWRRGLGSLCGGGGGSGCPRSTKDRGRNTRLGLDCYWVGSLDFNFWVEIKGFATKPPKSFTKSLLQPSGFLGSVSKTWRWPTGRTRHDSKNLNVVGFRFLWVPNKNRPRQDVGIRKFGAPRRRREDGNAERNGMGEMGWGNGDIYGSGT